jgi:hypothetical protein
LDSSDDARRPIEVPVDGDDAAWDAHDVWRERVREARAQPTTPRVRVTGPLPAPSGGWDPLETWRDRVLRPRRR